MLDHSPINSAQRNLALQLTKDRWSTVFPEEPFEVDLSKPPPVLTEYQSRIQYNLEEACYRQFKFYYQVSLPHYSDDLFLQSAVERYEHHLQLKKLHPDVSMVPCYDVELIWHTHQLHPLNYKRTTAELLGKSLHHDDTVRGRRTPASVFYDFSERKTREVWKAAGLRFAKAGAMYRGDPPDPTPPPPNWLYLTLARLEYSCWIRKIEALGFKSNEVYFVRVENLTRELLFKQAFKGSDRLSTNHPPHRVTLDNGTKHTVIVSLYKPGFIRMKFITESQVDLLPYLPTVSFDCTVRQRPIIIDVPLCGGQYTVKLTLKIDPPIITKYWFEIQPRKDTVRINHPSMILNCPQEFFPASDLAKHVSLPCDCYTQPVHDWRGNQAFSCRVVHITDTLLSALEIINLYGQVVASAHTISPDTFPERKQVQDHQKNFLNPGEDENAMLIRRGNKDWGVCIAKLQETSLAVKDVDLKFYKLFGERGWCSVRNFSYGVWLIKFDSDTMVRVDLKLNRVVISPRAQSIPQSLALAFSLLVLYRLCIPNYSLPSEISLLPSQTASFSFTVAPFETFEDKFCHDDFNEDIP
ncbi:hypothetical protein ACROYT_G016438 [Oculina patagonica]